MKLVLATTSKYKKQKFSQLDIPFTAVPSNVDEKSFRDTNPRKLVAGLARMKAKAVAKKHHGAIIIGADSIAYWKRHILEKPATKDQAIKRLQNLSGKKHTTYTGLYALNTLSGQEATIVVKTDAWMRKLSLSEIKHYVDNEATALQTCLGYDPEAGLSASFVKRISGSYHNFLSGMPIEVVPDLLKKIGY